MKILLIEDDREAAGYLLRALKESGHVADHAADGEEGLTLARGGGYEVLIVDRMIPKLDESIRGLESGRVGCVHVVGNLAEGDLLRALESPGDVGTALVGDSA